MAQGSYLITRDKDKQRSWPSAPFKARYKIVRTKLGLATGNNKFPHLHKHSTLIWKFDELDRNIEWVWAQYLEKSDVLPMSKGQLMVNIIGATFGIAVKDLRGQTRDQVVVIPRQLGIAMLRKDGLSYYKIGKAFHRDTKTCAHAVEQMARHMEKLDERTNRRGHSPVGQPEGQLPASIPEVAAQDRQGGEAGPDSADGGPNGTEGPAPSGSSE